MRETLAFGSLISATDPVCILAAFKEYTTDPNFFLIVFGESILNDAVSMVFYDTIAEGGNHQGENHGFASVVYQFFYILIGSTIIGLLIGFISSAILKKITEGDKNSQRIEVGTMVSLPWIAYLASHISSFSGIVVIFFIGIGSAMFTRSYIKEHTREVNIFNIDCFNYL